MVLWQQVSHLLLKYTKSGYGTVLTAACARQGCSATEYESSVNFIVTAVTFFEKVKAFRSYCPL
jgi:hypothetical protein